MDENKKNPLVEKDNKKNSQLVKKDNYIVTDRQFKTVRRTYKISKIEKTEIRRNLIFILPLSILSLLFINKFWVYIYPGEAFWGITIALITGLFSISFGTLYIHSKALGEPALFGFIPKLRRIRNEVDDAMNELEEKSNYTDIENEES